MDEIADLTTPKFRDNKPKSVWVVDTWKTLQKLKYKRLDSNIIDSKIEDNKLMVVVKAKIETATRETIRKEIYYLVKDGNRWLIDEMIVTGKKVVKRIVRPGMMYNGKTGKVVPMPPEVREAWEAFEKETEVEKESD